MRRLPLLLVVWLAGCAATAPAPPDPPPGATAELRDGRVVAEDGYQLPMRRWLPPGDPEAVVLALHGFNDHAGSLEPLALSLRGRGIAVHAIDQRGFGTTSGRGLWHGEQRLVDDARLVLRLLRQRYPAPPLYLIGKSMGGAVAMLALTGDSPAEADGAVLIAPAVWGLETMPWYQRLGLRLAVRLFPGLSLSSRVTRRLGIRPTDDPEVIRAMLDDPLIQRRARIDTLHGLIRLMDAASRAGARLPPPTLLLYGEQDEVIPPEPICRLLERLPDRPAHRLVLYPAGFHMLTRYSGDAMTHADIAAWLLDPRAALPSGHELDHDGARERLCQD
ncbi:lysophospholipase [Halomonas sp. EGI 63088]|uniref:Lysophospholipase n=1 Tax=Halomonas flagellata TaxID=2920385 RepID=A0ABS9RUL0_9GAMM|nr:lysophospholipase [Halomonas flagellata]